MNKSHGTAALLMTALQLGIGLRGEANERGFMIGAGVGESSFDTNADLDVDVAAVGIPVALAAGDLDDRGDAFYGTVGYRFSRHLAAEAEYIDLGEAVFVAGGSTPGSPPNALTLRLERGATGYSASVLGIVPLGHRWEIFGRLSLLFAETTTSARLAHLSSSESERAQSAVLGVGGALRLGERSSARLEYRAFDEDVRTVTIALMFSPRRAP